MKKFPIPQPDGASSPSQGALSSAQRRLWVLERLHPGNPAHHVACSFRLAGQLDIDQFKNAWQEVVQQHDILRATFYEVEGQPQTVIVPPLPARLSALNVQDLSAQRDGTTVSELAQENIHRPFDLASGALRAALWRITPQEHVFLLVAHRIVCDEASLEVLARQLAFLYDNPLIGDSQKSCETPIQYREFAARQEKTSAERLSYWKEQLSGAPASLDLPADHPRPTDPTFRGASQVFSLASPLLEQLRGVVDQDGATLFTTLLAAFNVLLFRYTNLEDLVVGTAVSGRGEPEMKSLVGPVQNFVALRTSLSGTFTFRELLGKINRANREAFSQHVPYELLLEQLPLQRDLTRNPLFQVAFSQQFSSKAIPAAALRWTHEYFAAAAELLDLTINVAEHDERVEIRFSYSTDLFEHSTIARMAGHFQNLLRSAAENPEQAVSHLSLLSPSERNQILVEWNDTRVDYPRNVPLHRFIEEQVENTPDAEALVYESERLTYRQLNERANQLAHYLRKLGVGPDILVAVCMERSLELVIALLAILKAGGAYVPLDPEYPKDRLTTMLDDAAALVVLTQAHLIGRVPEAVSTFCLDRDWPELAAEKSSNLHTEVGGKHLAYAIYTSGSTGKPKGVPNVHESIVNRLLWMQDMYRLTGSDRVLQKTSFGFDVSVWEFFWPLMTGATLVMARPGGHRDPAYLVNLIAEQKITTLHFVPSMLSIFLETDGLERCRALRLVFASGEALPFELQRRFFEKLPAQLHNLYGPTEAAVDVTFWACRPDYQQAIVPIGRPIANTQIYVLDRELQPAPIGVAGELHIGGIGLARGYLNRPDLTAEKFIRDPFSHAPNARLYKTGDLARFLTDGNVEYLGRIDHQVKLRGFRIELGEIEAVIAECAGVRQAVVIMREDHPGDKRLVSYLVPTHDSELDVNFVRREVKNKLPEHMVPSRFLILEQFPMTTSGKIDRRALPAPPPDPRTSAAFVAPRNEMESVLASIFSSILSLPSVSVTDNFFDLGGHSLLAGRMLSELKRTTGHEIPLSALFRGATVESLTQLIGEQHLASDSVVMEIQRGDNRGLPFFAVVPPGEESLGYAMLARHMGSNQTVYKIQGHTPVLDGKRPYSQQEMRDLTDEYVTAMRTAQPHGPYCLGGLCDGTHIAEQIVLSLEAQGEEIGFFAIFDTWVMQHSQRRWLWKVDYYRQRLRQMQQLKPGARLASVRRIAENKAQTALGKKAPRTDWQETYWPEDFIPPRFRAPVILFKRPKQQFYYINDPEMGWGRRSEGGVEVHAFEFHHQQILREPHVRIFGETLSACMARVNRRAFDLDPSIEDQQTPLTLAVQPVRQDS